MLDQIGGRKLIALGVILVIGVVTVAIKGDLPEHFQAFLEVILGIYVGGNVVSKPFQKAATIEASSTISVEPDPALTRIEGTNTEIAKGVSLIQQLLELIIRRAGIDRMPEPPRNT